MGLTISEVKSEASERRQCKGIPSRITKGLIVYLLVVNYYNNNQHVLNQCLDLWRLFSYCLICFRRFYDNVDLDRLPLRYTLFMGGIIITVLILQTRRSVHFGPNKKPNQTKENIFLELSPKNGFFSFGCGIDRIFN